MMAEQETRHWVDGLSSLYRSVGPALELFRELEKEYGVEYREGSLERMVWERRKGQVFQGKVDAGKDKAVVHVDRGGRYRTSDQKHETVEEVRRYLEKL